MAVVSARSSEGTHSVIKAKLFEGDSADFAPRVFSGHKDGHM
jgi:hypothetical protein